MSRDFFVFDFLLVFWSKLVVAHFFWLIYAIVLILFHVSSTTKRSI